MLFLLVAIIDVGGLTLALGRNAASFVNELVHLLAIYLALWK